jgi:predicted RNase H-like nuclease (RuvC/YqgF family)
MQQIVCVLFTFFIDYNTYSSNESLKLKTENSQLKMKVEELTREVQSLDRQLKGARGRKVANAEKRGILPNEDRKSLEPLVKVYFNQKVTAFADEYGEQAAEKRKVFTSCFIVCYETCMHTLNSHCDM